MNNRHFIIHCKSRINIYKTILYIVYGITSGTIKKEDKTKS